MKKKLFRLLLIAVCLVSVLATMTVLDVHMTSLVAHAQTTPTPGEFDDLDFDDVVNIVRSIARIVLGIAGAIIIAYGLWSAILFLSAGGSGDRVEKAKKNFLWYIIGGAVIANIPWILSMFFKILKFFFNIDEPPGLSL